MRNFEINFQEFKNVLNIQQIKIIKKFETFKCIQNMYHNILKSFKCLEEKILSSAMLAR